MENREDLMGGVLGGLFGGGQQTSQSTQIDPTSQAMNNLRYQQTADYLGAYPTSSLGYDASGYQGSPYAMTTQSQNALNQAIGQDIPTDSIPNYETNFNPNYNTNFGQGYNSEQINKNFDTNYGQGFNSNLNSNFNTNFGQGYNTGLNNQFNQNFNTNFTPQSLQTPTGELMSMDQYKNLGLDASSNYISQIASPEIKAQLALQGQEGSGALPEALAKATAGVAQQFVQSIPGVGQANAGVRVNEADAARQNAALQMQGTGMANTAIGQQNQAQQMGNEAMMQANQAQAMKDASMMQGNQAQQMSNAALMQGNQVQQMRDTATDQANQARAMGNTAVMQYNNIQQMRDAALAQSNQAQQMGNETLFNMNSQRMQQAALPGQLAAQRMNTAATNTGRLGQIFSMADQPRSLAEQDLSRRQGLGTTMLTGIPYTPATSTSGRQSSAPLFNWFGMG